MIKHIDMVINDGIRKVVIGTVCMVDDRVKTFYCDSKLKVFVVGVSMANGHIRMLVDFHGVRYYLDTKWISNRDDYVTFDLDWETA